MSAAALVASARVGSVVVTRAVRAVRPVLAAMTGAVALLTASGRLAASTSRAATASGRPAAGAARFGSGAKRCAMRRAAAPRHRLRQQEQPRRPGRPGPRLQKPIALRAG
ncbi:MAG: hypothetical protein WKG07_08655 [Hymenobacter sp.]